MKIPWLEDGKIALAVFPVENGTDEIISLLAFPVDTLDSPVVNANPERPATVVGAANELAEVDNKANGIG